MDIRVNRKLSMMGENPVVRDSNGIFYRKDGKVSFNLPPGEYSVENCEVLGMPIKYLCPMLPFPEKLSIRPNFDKIKLVQGTQVLTEKGTEKIRLAAIDISRNTIIINPELGLLSTCEILCVLMHELGHYHYYTESKCDKFACYHLLKHGLNPSQLIGFISTLSQYSNERKEQATQYAEKIRTR
jgi:hypothetical protein